MVLVLGMFAKYEFYLNENSVIVRRAVQHNQLSSPADLRDNSQ